jgi:hypothetical protein
MKRIALTIFGLATAVLAASGSALAQDQPQTTQRVEGNAQLNHRLDTKFATQGEAVTAKLTDSITTSQGVKLPRNTRLLGHVDQVKASENGSPSTLVITFDKAQLKDGNEIAIKAIIVAVSAQGEAKEIPMNVASDGRFLQQAGTIAGVSLHSAVQDSSSGTLTGDHRNIKLASGTELLVAIGAPPATASSGVVFMMLPLITGIGRGGHGKRCNVSQTLVDGGHLCPWVRRRTY